MVASVASRHYAHAVAPVSFSRSAACTIDMEVGIIFSMVYGPAGEREIDWIVVCLEHSITQNVTINSSANLKLQATKK